MRENSATTASTARRIEHALLAVYRAAGGDAVTVRVARVTFEQCASVARRAEAERALREAEAACGPELVAIGRALDAVRRGTALVGAA